MLRRTLLIAWVWFVGLVSNPLANAGELAQQGAGSARGRCETLLPAPRFSQADDSDVGG